MPVPVPEPSDSFNITEGRPLLFLQEENQEEFEPRIEVGAYALQKYGGTISISTHDPLVFDGVKTFDISGGRGDLKIRGRTFLGEEVGVTLGRNSILINPPRSKTGRLPTIYIWECLYNMEYTKHFCKLSPLKKMCDCEYRVPTAKCVKCGEVVCHSCSTMLRLGEFVCEHCTPEVLYLFFLMLSYVY